MSKETCSYCNKGKDDVSKLFRSPAKYGSNVYICDQCVTQCNNFLETAETNDRESNKLEIKYTPEELKELLDKDIVGQDHAKELLSLAVYNHYKRVNYNTTEHDVELSKSNIMLLGPSGSGKTFLISSISKLLNIPFVSVDSTSLTEAGYVGDHVETIFTRLIAEANGDIELAQRGIVFIDEIDKKRSKKGTNSAGSDVSGEGVQQSLLRVLEGTTIKLELNSNSMFSPRQEIMFDTTNVLFIVGGAFIGLDAVINKRLSSTKSQMGFGSEAGKPIEGSLFYVEPEDLYTYGFIREFVGRFPVLIAFHDVTETMLRRILVEPKSSILKQYQTMFKLDNIELEFDEDFIKSVATTAFNRKTGARGLRTILEKELSSIAYRLPSIRREGFSKIIIHELGKHNFIKGQNEDI
ncbi:hypothetical protein Cassandra_0053 [Pseudomonas phage Cassandra]|nr:hypothetical protein Cassandra_0053 [Pseudomonas phage Cassandra]WPK39250.1 hypothetical protein Deiofobo_0053 [Pseudomonas phage Deifobo]WPK39762.1 hypothetical protein ETTORE_0053 [Pseudomonas phage Ettore]WPK40283.1 hypothetical protein Paride_0053 [Pseudomonas phage Paride]BDR25792.1 ATP-dependent Clp protease ATP-binding subunit ClpX [Pseudomonas phage sp. 30-2]